jgi:deoxyribonuclease-4
LQLFRTYAIIKKKGGIYVLQLGCHLSASAGNVAMVKTALSIGANTFAFFTRNPRGSQAKKEDPADCVKAVGLLAENGFGKLVAHGAYTMNLCTKDPQARAFAAEILKDDLRRMAALPGNFYNFHPGSHVGQGTDTGIAQIVDALKAALAPGYPVTVLLETMAGKGSEIGGRFEELRAIMDGVGSDNVGVCLDTCHVFDGGYDIVHDLDGVLQQFDDIIGLDRLKALHLNDSKNPFGSHKDRHACIGEGSLGVETFRSIVNHPALQGKPMILETPNELPGYAAEIALLRSL